MEVGLELFSKEFGEYPDSMQIDRSGGTVCGAQRLAEALLGRDERGFHPRSKWHPNDDMAAAPPHPGTDLYTDATEKDRKPPYIDLRHCGVYTIYELWGTAKGTISNIYDSGASPINGTARAPVITDVFRRNRSTVVEEKVGMPVLYFKADPTKDFRMISYGEGSSDRYRFPAKLSDLTPEIYRKWIYNFDDNLPVLQLLWLREPTADTDTPEVVSPHYTEEPDDTSTNAAGLFYKILTQTEKDTDSDGVSDFFKCYNPDTFILISAGYDGIFGTKDDVTNFDY